MTAREQQRAAASYLSRYRTARAEVDDIQRRIERARSDMMGVRGISYEGGDMPKAHNVEHDLSDYIARIDGLLREWQDAQNRALDTMREISEAINAVENDCARRVLMLYYVDGYKFEKIAEMIPCAPDTVFRWRRIGLLQVQVNSK